MKKSRVIICVILVFVMLLALCACGSNSTPSGTTPSNNTPSNNTPADNNAGKDDGKGDEKDETPAENKETYTLKFAMADPVGTIFDEYMAQPLIKLLNDNSGGRIQCELYPSGTVAAFGSGLDSARTGTSDIAQDAFSFYTGVYPYTELINTPGIDYGSLSSFNTLIIDYAKAFPEDMDEFVVVSRWAGSYFGFLMPDKPITCLADLQGKTLRSTGSFMNYCTALGATGVMVTPNDLYEGIKLGVVDGAQFTLGGTCSYGLYDVCNYFTPIEAYYGDTCFVLARETYDRMDAEAQAAIDKTIEDFLPVANKYSDANDQLSLDEILNEHNPDFKMYYMTDEAKAEIVKVAEPLLQAKADELNALGLDGDGALEWLRTNAKKYA